MAGVINIGADNASDQFYRYKMPKLQARVRGPSTIHLLLSSTGKSSMTVPRLATYRMQSNAWQSASNAAQVWDSLSPRSVLGC